MWSKELTETTRSTIADQDFTIVTPLLSKPEFQGVPLGLCLKKKGVDFGPSDHGYLLADEVAAGRLTLRSFDDFAEVAVFANVDELIADGWALD